MPDTVDDFMRRFASGGTVDDVDASRFHDRFVSTHPDDAHFDNRAYHEGAAQYLGQLPDDQFHNAARNAVAQAPPQERAGLLGGLLSALGAASAGSAGAGAASTGATAGGGGLAGLASMLGLGSTDPNRMSEDDAARVMNYARKEHPEIMQQAVKEKPWFVKAMGNPVVMGALTLAAAKLLSNQRKGNA
jgi:hypothetical protein